MADKPLNRTYSRISRQPTRKPLGTFNSAPFLPKVTHSVFKPSDDSLDDFVVTKKYVRKKTATFMSEQV